MADIDNRPTWWMGIFLVCYTTFLIALMSGHPGYAAIIAGLEAFAGLEIYSRVEKKAIRIGTGATWWRIWFLDKLVAELDPEKKPGVDQEEAGEYGAYALDGEPELVMASDEEVERVFTRPALTGMWGELNTRKATTYGTRPASRVVTVPLEAGEVMHDLGLAPHQVNLNDYPLEYFLERRLSAHVSKKAHKFLRGALGVKKTLEAFLALDKDAIQKLQLDIHDQVKQNVDLVGVQMHLRHSFSVYFTGPEIDFFHKKGYRTLADLSASNLDQLEHEFNARHARFRALGAFKSAIVPVPLKRYVTELVDELASNLSKVLHKLCNSDYADYIRVLETALLDANPGSYFYRVSLKRAIPVPIKNRDAVEATINVTTIYVELPALLPDAVKMEECTMYPLGFPVKVQTSSTFQLALRYMLTSDRPVYYAADCTYWREHSKKSSPAGSDKWYESCVKALSKELMDTAGEVQKTMTLYERSESTIQVQHSTINNTVALALDAENVPERVGEEKNKIKVRMAPTRAEKPVFWALVVVVGLALFLAGLFIGLTFQAMPAGGGVT